MNRFLQRSISKPYIDKRQNKENIEKSVINLNDNENIKGESRPKSKNFIKKSILLKTNQNNISNNNILLPKIQKNDNSKNSNIIVNKSQLDSSLDINKTRYKFKSIGIMPVDISSSVKLKLHSELGSINSIIKVNNNSNSNNNNINNQTNLIQSAELKKPMSLLNLKAKISKPDLIKQKYSLNLSLKDSKSSSLSSISKQYSQSKIPTKFSVPIEEPSKFKNTKKLNKSNSISEISSFTQRYNDSNNSGNIIFNNPSINSHCIVLLKWLELEEVLLFY